MQTPRGRPRTPTRAAITRALRHRNYRLFFVGQGISLIGTWLTRVAMSWLVYRLTGSAVLLGVAGFAGQIPTFLLAPVAGVLVDRWSRHRVLVVCQVLAMLQSAALAVVAITGVVSVAQVLSLAAFQGLVNAFDTPARQSFVVEMIDAREDLPNAIALNSSMVNGARLIGPSVGGVLIAAVGEGWCFALDAASYAAVIAALLAMRVAPHVKKVRALRVLSELREGFAYVRGFRPIRSTLLLLAFVSFTGMPYAVLMPIFASKVLGGGPHTLGILMAASGLGAVTGALYLASRESVLGLARTLLWAGALFGASLMAFALSHALLVSVLLIALAGGGMMVQMAASNTLIQTWVDEDKRGRVMSFYTMAFFGMMPFGSLAAGLLAARVGAQATVFAGGAATVVAIAAFARKLPALHRDAHPVYVRLGLVTEVASGLNTSPPDE